MHDEMSFLFNNKNPNNYKFKKRGSIKIVDKVIDKSFHSENEDANPYTEIINKLRDRKSMKLEYSDFAYLTDLGVFPINRLIILRRFDENVIVEHDLDKINAEPISVLVSWISPEEEKMFSLNFNEVWVDQRKFFWEEFAEMIKGVTGINTSKMVSLPGWAQGFLLNFLKEAGFVKEPEGDEKFYLPVGDPNILRETKTRSLDGQGLKSSIGISFKSKYEQKYIKGIDPGLSMMKVINNGFAMGTSNMKFIFNGNGDAFNNLKETVKNNTTKEWTKTIINIMKTFADALFTMVKGRDHTISNDSFRNNDGGGIIDLVYKSMDLAIQRYRWDLKTSLALTTGDPTTPWHMTVGNPLNPLLSIGNIVLDQGVINFGNEMNFNNLPDKIDISFNIDFGRPLGHSELLDIFNIEYERKVKIGGIDIYQYADTISGADPSDSPKDNNDIKKIHEHVKHVAIKP